MNIARGLEQVLDKILLKKITWTKTTGTFYITGIKYLVKYFYSRIFTWVADNATSIRQILKKILNFH